MTPNEALAADWWHLIAHETELATPGDWLRFDWPLGELVVMNDGGALLAFDNVCPHRGGRFFVGASGQGAAICPYHGWRIRDGAVKAAQAARFKPCDLERAVLNRHQVQRFGPWVFAGIAPRQTLEDQLGDLAKALLSMGQDVERRTDLLVETWDCDWRVALENALETYHVAPIHGTSLGTLGLTDESWRLHGANSDYTAQVGAARTARGLQAMGRFFEAPSAHAGYRSIHVFPFAMVSSTFGYSSALQTFMPGETGDTRFTTRMLGARRTAGMEAPADAFLASSARMNRQVFEEDRAICERVSRRYDLDAPDRIFADNEGRVAHFADTLRSLAAAPAERRRA
jgi:phenylpropionate dioxygenase-like ring-hydroxylating dioxygenase large terminal subunit